ncbi:hypothetical protein GpartN1_g1463.t1 [Galdieria partita]|uniref:CCT domain-containing protein n=1 Tax=Galdieria partita TaxID=83374 RepID=A0A9C7PU19_9RHOD|nr:hypothetical protein GpartN1_g1463.t1 [Galdieria partita]
MSVVQSKGLRQREEKRKPNCLESDFTSHKDQIDELDERNGQASFLKRQGDRWEDGYLQENVEAPKDRNMEIESTEYPQLDRINSDTNIAVEALFEIAARTDTSHKAEDGKYREDLVASKNENIAALNARGRKLRRQWNSKMTPEEVRLAYLHRMKEERDDSKTRRKRKKELSISQDEKFLKDICLKGWEEQHDQWYASVNSSGNKELSGCKSDSDDSDVVEGTDSSGNGNGSSNDNNTGTGSGSGSNHGHSVKNSVHRSPALSTFEKNAEVDIWRRMNLKSNEYVDRIDSHNILSLSGTGSSFMERNHFLSPSISSSGTSLSHRKKTVVGERCSAEERKEKLERYRRKREERIFRKQVRYDVRKRLAESRPRVRGRFCKPSEQQALSERHTSSEPPNEVID